jgi:hypothetical protein
MMKRFVSRFLTTLVATLGASAVLFAAQPSRATEHTHTAGEEESDSFFEYMRLKRNSHGSITEYRPDEGPFWLFR